MEEKFPYEQVKGGLLVKRKATTNQNYKVDRSLLDYGIINLNKPSGPTSHQSTDYVKKILKLNKAGHSGTLV